jgi:hypothetical protein
MNWAISMLSTVISSSLCCVITKFCYLVPSRLRFHAEMP